MLPVSVWDRIDCSKCPDRDACDRVPYDCPAENPPMKYPKFIKTFDGYIGAYRYSDNIGPVYAFPGGMRYPDRWELEHGSENREELEGPA